VGRHALLLAEHGLAVEAIDGSAAGLAVVRETARARGLSLGVLHGTADALPFDDASFDFVLSWNVIHHGTLGDVGRRLAEIWRVLKPKAPTARHRCRVPRSCGEAAPGQSWLGSPCDAATLVALFAGFELLSLKQQLRRKPGSWHWHIIAERRPQSKRNVTIFATGF
jgi:SAM-dependent methyltransferase